jgi:hypothetical protein
MRWVFIIVESDYEGGGVGKGGGPHLVPVALYNCSITESISGHLSYTSLLFVFVLVSHVFFLSWSPPNQIQRERGVVFTTRFI